MEYEMEVKSETTPEEIVAKALGVAKEEFLKAYDPYRGVHVGGVRRVGGGRFSLHYGPLQGIDLKIYDPKTLRMSTSRRVMVEETADHQRRLIDLAQVRDKYTELATAYEQMKARYDEKRAEEAKADQEFRAFEQELGIKEDRQVHISQVRSVLQEVTELYNLNFSDISKEKVRALVAAWKEAA